jgi:quercetin dioxygenase-like cupin family protein
MPGPKIRRVVTGHDADANAIIKTDDVIDGERFTLIWTTNESPADNNDESDGGKRQVGIAHASGSVFRIADIVPGQKTPMHRTNSVDYGLVLDGEIDLEVDGGEVVHLKRGDVVVQRGTNHLWVNNSNAICRMAWVLLDAHPYNHKGQPLDPILF